MRFLGPGTVVEFSPKILELNAEILKTISDSPGLDFGIVFGQSGTEITGLFWAFSGLIFGLLLVHLCCC